MARRSGPGKGLGRGLDALFADAAPIYEELAEEPEAEQREESGAAEDRIRSLGVAGKPSGKKKAMDRAEKPDRGTASGESGEDDVLSSNGKTLKNGKRDKSAVVPGQDHGNDQTAGSADNAAGSFEAENSPEMSDKQAGASRSQNSEDRKAGASRSRSSGDRKAAASKSRSSGDRKITEEADTGRADRQTAEEDEDRIIYIDINDIKPNSAQPRQTFNEEKLRELAESIKANGVIQPVIVRRYRQGYELVAGERRWRASRIAGLRKIPAILRNFDDTQNAIVAIIENMQREDLNPIEEARGLRSMTEVYGFTQEQISASLGRSRTYIANSIRLLKLPEDIQEYVSSGQMSAAHGRTIINISDPVRQKELADRIISSDLSVRATEKLAAKLKEELKPEQRKRRKTGAGGQEAKSAELRAAEQELMAITGTRVNITGESSGRLEMEFYSTAELNRIIDILREAFGRERTL